ncbi:hypothetical protein [Paenirhodobacter populi]|nr:hypothetical protein [Sinirhodobacter populi]
MRIARFEFSEGARFQPGARKDDPNSVGQHIDLLRKQQHGELTPKDVVSDARNPNSPLHSFFEWDDGEAAEQYRLQQARGLIRSVVAIYTREDAPAVKMKAYVHVADPGAQHYREASHAMSQERTREMVLRRALDELIGWKRRYKDLQEFAQLIPVIDQLRDEISAPR